MTDVTPAAIPRPAPAPVRPSRLLTGLLILEHTLSDNVFKGRGLFSRLLDARTIGFSLIEAAGAAIWLALVEANLAVVGIVILVVASFIEHLLAVALGRKKTVTA